MKYNLIIILGPTAAGKTRLATLLAHRFNGEIISADSRQVYKGMDIGTGKDLDDYFVEGNVVPYHLIDVIEPAEEFNLYLFNKLFEEAYNKIISKNKIPFLAGGTGLYLHSVIKGYNLETADFESAAYEELNSLSIEELRAKLKSLNPKLHNTTDLLIKERIIKAIIVSEKEKNTISNEAKKNNPLVIGINLERSEIKKRITERLKLRLQNGMIDEVKKLTEEGTTFEKLDFFGLEYKFIGRYLKGELSYNDMYQKLNSAIHSFAKRQMTWFRKMEREGITIHWINGVDYSSAEKIILEHYR
ncbi:MAG: tRNA (adenosine(37)-N6)-dimethylallyltransferase MiaA [Ignavibacteriales bacterium]|nr:tRNA (adenosine(37)-N6)-dimethylallyltransferase MiaA [Ignavibacteriales bacterium]